MITPTMHYGKIAGGRLDHEMQLAFLEAQTMAELVQNRFDGVSLVR